MRHLHDSRGRGTEVDVLQDRRRLSVRKEKEVSLGRDFQVSESSARLAFSLPLSFGTIVGVAARGILRSLHERTCVVSCTRIFGIRSVVVVVVVGVGRFGKRRSMSSPRL